MARNHTLAPTPLTFELPRVLVDWIHACRGRLGLKSASAVVRKALEAFDYTGFRAPHREQCQISVRLSPVQKRLLFYHARRQKVSAGVLLRSALEALSPQSVGTDGRLSKRRGSAAGKNDRKPAKHPRARAAVRQKSR